jgi:redox-sensitive bicupin YhaK (pirin superfamily)
MLIHRPAAARGHADHGWLQARHSFSFAEYHDPRWMGFSVLRVINEDTVQPGAGFPTHGHRDMEIVTYVLSGLLEHKDSMGNGSLIRPGEVQRMSAGTGVRHSEFNASASEPLHLLQIWLLPERGGIAPGYEQKAFAADERRGRLRPLIARDGREGALSWHQDATLYGALLAAGDAVSLPLAAGRKAWAQLARGALLANGQRLAAGDGLGLAEETVLELRGVEEAELLVFDLP